MFLSFSLRFFAWPGNLIDYPLCAVNGLLIIVLCVLSLGFSILSLLVEHGALLPSSLITLYLAYSSWSMYASQPNTEHFSCNSLNSVGEERAAWQLIAGLTFTLASIAYQTMAAASSFDNFTGSTHADYKTVGSEEDMSLIAPSSVLDVDSDGDEDTSGQGERPSYNYLYFHIVFALGTMYMAMLLTDWNVSGSEDGNWHVGQGWEAVALKLVSLILVCGLYYWSLLAPHILYWRDFGTPAE